jgi:hypothetical protein
MGRLTRLFPAVFFGIIPTKDFVEQVALGDHAGTARLHRDTRNGPGGRFIWPVAKQLLRSKVGLVILDLGAASYLGGFFNLSTFTGGGSRVVDTQQEDEWAAFIKTVHGDLEAVWSDVFAQAGLRYQPPTLVLYRGATNSA